MRLMINMTMKMAIGSQPGIALPRAGAAWRGARTPSSVTPRPWAMRPMIRSEPARSPPP